MEKLAEGGRSSEAANGSTPPNGFYNHYSLQQKNRNKLNSMRNNAGRSRKKNG